MDKQPLTINVPPADGDLIRSTGDLVGRIVDRLPPDSKLAMAIELGHLLRPQLEEIKRREAEASGDDC